MTRADFENKTQDFFNRYDGKYLDVDNAYSSQCVDVIKAFFVEVLGISGKARGNAKDYWNACPELIKIPNTPELVPMKGDVVVWGTGIGQYGHIAIAKGWGDTNVFDSFDQNFPVGTPCHFVRHNYNSVLGVLRSPNVDDAPPPPPVDPREVRIKELEAKYTELSTYYTELQTSHKNAVEKYEKNEETLHDEIDIRDTEIKTLRSEIEKLHKIWDGHKCETRELSIHDHLQAVIEYVKQLFKKK